MDMGPAYAKAVRERAPAAVICFDPFHVIKVATDGLDAVRRQVWQVARTLPDQRIAKTFKGARWALLKNPADLTDTQAQTLREMKRTGGILWRAYQLKEALREIFAGDLDAATTAELLDRWCARAQRSRIPEFVKAGRTIRKHRAGIDMKGSTPRSGFSSDAPTASTAPRPPSLSFSWPAGPSLSNSHTTREVIHIHGSRAESYSQCGAP